jgi:ribonuclease T1
MSAARRRGHATIHSVPVLTTAVSRTCAALAAALVVVLLAGCGAGAAGTVAASATAPTTVGATTSPGSASTGSSSGSGSSSAPAAKPTPEDAATLAPGSATTDLSTVLVSALPRQGVDTLRLIRDDGPFPYSKDGVTFSNRERILPPHPSGWYREYTVITPGSSDRGARRIIAGKDGARFYTDDHYASFREVLSGVTA